MVQMFRGLPTAVRDMNGQVQRLKDVRDNIQADLARQHKNAKTIVQNWLNKADIAIQSSESVNSEYEQHKNCLGFCPNCLYRYKISKEVRAWKLTVDQFHSEKSSDFPYNWDYGDPTPLTQIPILHQEFAAQSELERWLTQDTNIRVKKRAAHNDGDSLRVGTDIRAYTTGQPGNPNGNSLEVGVVEIRTHTVEEMPPLEVGMDIRTYTLEELAKATNNFTTKVGQGVSGFVYRANLPGDRMGAVKRATDLDPNLFKHELSVLLRLPRHPHLVDLIGLCLQPGEQILVFEFISNGSLHDRLHKNKGNNRLINPLSWTARMDIAYQVALALQYLHDEAKPPILHRDVKSANVLLVNDNSAKLADFGLSKLGPKDNEFTITAVRGSCGYMDPQYEKTRRYSAKSDVYSFGVLLLELITGLKPLQDGTPLAEWTQTYRSAGVDSFLAIVDRTVVERINMRELQNMIKIANLCLSIIIEERCLMKDIVNMMQETPNINGNGNLSDVAEAPFLENGNVPNGGGAITAS